MGRPKKINQGIFKFLRVAIKNKLQSGNPKKKSKKLTVLSFYDPVEFWRLCEEIWEVDFPDKWLSFRMSTLEKTFLLPSFFC